MMVIDYIDRGARVAPDAPCMVLPDGTVTMTHGEFHALTHRIAASLLADGLLPGERVAIYSPNDAHAFACVVAVIRAGGIWTAVNAASRVEELASFLTLAGCSRTIYHGSLAEQVDALVKAVPALGACVSIGTGRPGDPELADWMAPVGTRAPAPPYGSDLPMMLMPTGGTTGAPKAVPFTNRQFHLMGLALNTHLAEPEPPRYICATPMTHAAGVVALPTLAEAGSIIVHQGVRPAEIFDSIEINRATRMFLPPTAVYALLGATDVRQREFSSLRHFLVAASPIAPDRLAEAVDVFGPVMVQSFGQAEAPMIVTLLSVEQIADAVANPEHRHRLAACGQPSVVAQVEIMSEDGRILGTEQPGEIVVRSDLVFRGYWENAEATSETVRPGGWHGTGDIGKRDADGYIYILDRKRDMIITGGFNVYPSEVEAVIHGFSQVNDCAVIGVPDDKWGEAVTAIVESKQGADIDTDAIIALCKERLGSVKAPKQVLIDDLPRSPAGKVLRRELRTKYWAGESRLV